MSQPVVSQFKQHLAKRILLVDLDEAFGHVLQQVLGAGYSLRQASNIEAGISNLDSRDLDVILLNLDFETKDSFPLLHAASKRASAPPVIAFGWDPRRNRAMQAFREGAVDFLEQPLDVQQLKFAIDAAHRRAALARELAAAHEFLPKVRVEGLLGNSKAMDRVNEMIRKVAVVFTSVLITGESGTGKDVVAKAIHRLSPRATKAFVAFSVCAFPDSLIEEELFGHEKGAYTGANQMRRGRFEEANDGTIFIDEIGDLALPLQAKLLRVLQERRVERLGSGASHPIDVRVISATSRNLQKMVEDGTFREDLYFRISVVNIQMPSLRERTEDIPLLAEYFLHMFAKTHNKRVRTLTPGFLSALARHSWRGNVRELQNVIERSVVLANGHDCLGVSDLPEELKDLTVPDDVPTGSFQEAVQVFKKELVRSALRMHDGNKLRAARELGISRCYLHRLLNQFNMADAAGRPDTLDELEQGS
jgi:DNA-binding NtrC family response regulator